MTAITQDAISDVSNEHGLRSDENRERWMVLGLCGPALFLIIIVMVVPVGWLFWLSFIGAEGSFKTHARLLLKEGVAADALRQAVLVTFAATAPFSSVIAALHWVDDLVENG